MSKSGKNNEEMERGLEGLMERVSEAWQFTDTNYPEFGDLPDNVRHRQALGHVLLHFQKSIGKIATALEAAEHGKEFDKEEVRKVIWKLLVNSLQMANLTGMKAQDLYGDLDKWTNGEESEHSSPNYEG